MFAELPRIEQPRPDVTYGLWKQDISASLRTILDTYHCDLAKGLYLPFLIVEVKTQDAIPGKAENQCIRGGASLVNTIHQWNRVAAGLRKRRRTNAMNSPPQLKKPNKWVPLSFYIIDSVLSQHASLMSMIGPWHSTK